MRKRPFFFIGLFSFSAALICSLTSTFISVVTVAVAALCLFTVALFSKGRLSPRIAAVAALFASVVVLLFSLRMTQVVEPQLALDGTTAAVTVRVKEKVATTNAYIVQVENGTLPSGTRLCFWPGYHGIAPDNGDLLKVDIELVAAYAEETESGQSAKANGVYLYAWPTENSEILWEDGQATLSPLLKALYALRDVLHDTLYRRMDYETAAFSEGMMLGRRGNLSNEVQNAFRASGVYHLLAVSGVHLSIITAAMMRILDSLRLPRRLQALLTAAMVILFMTLCGFTASVTRAGVMTLMVLGAGMLRHRADGLNALGFAATVLLLSDPFCMYDIGWQLSFAATLGLLLFVPVWEQEITIRAVKAMPRVACWLRPLSASIGVSICATLATVPLTALYFGGVSAVFLPGNLVCVPLSSALLLVDFLAVLTAWIAPLSQALFALSGWMAEVLTVFAARLADFQSATVMFVETYITWWMFGLLAAMTWGYVRHRLRGLFCAVCAMLLVLAVGGGIYTAVNREVSRIAVAASDQIVVTVHTDDSCGLIVSASGDALKDADKLLQDEGILSLDWVLWLAEPSHTTVELSSLCVPIGQLLITAPPDGFMSLPPAKEITVFDADGALRFAEDGLLERCGEFWRLRIGQTACVFTVSDRADAAQLPSAWWDSELVLLQEIPANDEYLHADHMMAFCAHGEQAAFREALEDAVIAIEGDTCVFLTRGDGNLTLHR